MYHVAHALAQRKPSVHAHRRLSAGGGPALEREVLRRPALNRHRRRVEHGLAAAPHVREVGDLAALEPVARAIAAIPHVPRHRDDLHADAVAERLGRRELPDKMWRPLVREVKVARKKRAVVSGGLRTGHDVREVFKGVGIVRAFAPEIARHEDPSILGGAAHRKDDASQCSRGPHFCFARQVHLPSPHFSVCLFSISPNAGRSS